MLLDIFDTIIGGINQVGQVLGLSWIAVISLSLLLVTIIISLVATIFSSEVKTARAVEKLNVYLESNPFINDENLVEFNKLMKKIPSQLRVQWQQFMVNRDKKPSAFFTEDNCIEKPFKASGYKNHITAVRATIVCLSILSFIFSIGAVANTASTLSAVLVNSLLLPLAILFVGELYLLILKSRRNNAISELFGIFPNFQHALDRAVTTLPDYVDYEILFTRKEIVNGIPVLQQYLQQRAAFEEEQIRKAKESQVEHEEYDFSSLGVNGSLVMERAMRECEYYLGNRKRILAEISELQGSRDLLDKSYDEKNKTNQRKLRDIQESLDRLKEKLDNTTNIIVGNDLRKQRENEIQKQRQLEREVEEDNNKYDADKKALDKQIEAKKAEIEDFRKTAEGSLNGEFKTYADKIYADMKVLVDNQFKDELDKLKTDNHQLQMQVEERDKALTEKTVMYDEKLKVIEDYANTIAEQEQTITELKSTANDAEEEISLHNATIESKDKEIFEINKTSESRKLEIEKKDQEIKNLKQSIKELKRKKQVEVYRYFDANGVEFFVDENGKPYYADENGNPIYENASSLEQKADENSAPQFEQTFDEDINKKIDNENSSQDEENKEYNEQNANFENEDNLINDDKEKNQVAENEIDENQVATEVKDEEFDLDDHDTQKQEPMPISEQIDKMLENLESDAEDDDDLSKKSKPIPENTYKKPLYDFTWENSNSPEDFDQEKSNEFVGNEEKQDIEEIEKEIQNQNEQLDSQAKNLSAQLEETKAISQKDTKKATKKSSARKKSSVKKTNSKKADKKPAANSKPAKKPADKKTTTKSNAKQKPASKSKTDKDKPKLNKEKAKKVAKPKNNNGGKGDNTGVNGDNSIGDLSLDEFSKQLKSVLKEINDSNNE